MLFALLVIGITAFAFLSLFAKRLLASAIWLAGVSTLCAVLFYMLGAHEVAVIELSVGVGLVTVLFVFAISIAGDEAMNAAAVVPVALIWALMLAAVGLLAWMILPGWTAAAVAAEPTSTAILWNVRGLDVTVQAVIIFAGVLTVLGLLAPDREPAAASLPARGGTPS